MADELLTLSGQISKLAAAIGGEMKVNKAGIAANAKAVSDLATKVAQDIIDAKKAVKDDLLGGAGDAYQTLKALADFMEANKVSIQALEALAAGHVKYDGEQELSAEEKAQARTNIGALGSADLGDLEGRMTTAEGKIAANESAISANSTAITTLSNNVGDCSTDFVAVFEAALTAVDEAA